MMMAAAISQARTRVRLDGGVEAFFHRGVVAPAVQLLEREGLHRLDGVERFAGQARGIGDAILRIARQPPHAPAEQQHGQRARSGSARR